MDCPLPLTEALTLRDVKNEGRSGYVYENTGNIDKLSTPKTGFLHKNAPIARYLTTIAQVYCRNYRGWEQESTRGEAVFNTGLPAREGGNGEGENGGRNLIPRSSSPGGKMFDLCGVEYRAAPCP
jgi:hypothetical protein